MMEANLTEKIMRRTYDILCLYNTVEEEINLIFEDMHRIHSTNIIPYFYELLSFMDIYDKFLTIISNETTDINYANQLIYYFFFNLYFLYNIFVNKEKDLPVVIEERNKITYLLKQYIDHKINIYPVIVSEILYDNDAHLGFTEYYKMFKELLYSNIHKLSLIYAIYTLYHIIMELSVETVDPKIFKYIPEFDNKYYSKLLRNQLDINEMKDAIINMYPAIQTIINLCHNNHEYSKYLGMIQLTLHKIKYVLQYHPELSELIL